MRKLPFPKLLSGALVIAGFALFIFVGKHVFATPNATDGADNQTVDRAYRPSISAVTLEKSVVFQLEGEPEDGAFWRMGGPSAKIALGANANAVLSLDLIADGGSGNQRDDGVTTGAVSGQGTTIAIEVFARGVTTSLRGVILKFKFDASLLSYVKAENSAFPLAIPDASAGTNLAATTPATLAASGFLARAEFETVADVTGREFSIGIESVTLAESSASQDELTTTREISFNATPSPDFDGDGTVGFSDFIAFASKFGTQRGDAAFDARFDLDGDGETGFSDFIVFARQFGTTVAPPPPTPAVAIPDANLRAVIADSLGKAENAPITRADMAALTGLIAPNKGIRNLTGLEYATNLRHLYLSGVETIDGEWFNSNDISDLSPLSNLTNLTLLSLGNNSISDISALSNLTNLTGLDLGINSISDISALSNLTNLTYLYLWDNDITEISALSNLNNLKGLDLNGNSITDISPLVSNTGLGNGDRVYLQDNPLSSTSRNTHIPALQRRGVTVEFDSSNGNGGGGGTTTPPSDSPDLIVESPVVSVGPLTTGESFVVGATVRNQGNASSASTTLRYYRSTDTTISSNDVEVGTDGVSALSAGGTSAESISLNAPSSAGIYYYGACVDPVSGESNTGNNCSAYLTVNVSGAGSPDLIVESPTVNDNTLTTGQSFTFSATVRNQGSASSGSTTLRYYRSTDATVSTSDTQVGTDAVSSLSAGGTSAESISLNAPSSAGTYFYGACVDAVSGESDNVNNCSVAVAVTVGAAPALDLVVDSPTVSNSSPTAGASFILSATVRNRGTGRSRSTTILRYYLSTDATISTSDTQVGGNYLVRALSAGGTSAGSISLNAPSSAGTYYYGACVGSVRDESDTENNCSAAVSVTVGAAPSPDLVVDSPTVDNSSPTPGASFTLRATVRNQGAGRSAVTTLRYYLSTDATVSTSDTEVGTDRVSDLSASRTSAEQIHLSAPASVGTYYYGACVESVSGESNTGNNCSSSVTVNVGAPDLVVDAPTVTNSSPTAGAYFNLRATVRNQGTGRSGSTSLNYYLSIDATVSASDTQVGTKLVSPLSASRTSAASIRLRAPSSAGTYYYGACVESVSDESDTENNCSAAVTVTVGAAPSPDLVVDSPTVSNSSPTAGAYFTLSATVRNQGTGRSRETFLYYYLSIDATVSTSDTLVHSDRVWGLSASGTSAASIRLRAPSNAGTYYYGACVRSVRDESDTGNNCSSSVTVTVGAAPAPDLVVDTPTVSSSTLTAGDYFNLRATVRNQGPVGRR